MIRHTVAFRLRHLEDSPAETTFLQSISKLRAIPGVEKFELLKQVSTKNKYTFGVSMEFDSSSAYQHYNEHPDHVAFVQDKWVPEVEEFIELDYIVFG